MGAVILVGVSIFAMYLFTYPLWILARASGEPRSIEVLSVGFLSVWIVHSILKSIFDSRTIGWWAAEAVLFVGLLIGPALLGSAYITAMTKSEKSQSRAALYSDLLVHDVSNYHQALVAAFDLLDSGMLPPEASVRAKADARTALTAAVQLVRNMRDLIKIDRLVGTKPVPTDLVSAILQALEQTLPYEEQCEFNVMFEEGIGCYVEADRFLVDAFHNLFRNAITYSHEQKRVEVEIRHMALSERDFWETRISDYGIGTDHAKRKGLFTRFMEDARGTGLYLSSTLS